MLSLPSRTKMFLCMNPVDMRKSFDGLFGIVREEFRQDSLSGHLFLFVNKRRDRMKAIFCDDDCLWIDGTGTGFVRRTAAAVNRFRTGAGSQCKGLRSASGRSSEGDRRIAFASPLDLRFAA